MSDSKFVEIDSKVRLVFSENSTSIRASGEWIPKSEVRPVRELDRVSMLFHLARGLPSWPLLNGINMDINSGGMIPDSHQFIPMDMIESGWFAGFGVKGGLGIPRSRLLIADEGGTGKTLSACLAARYISLRTSNTGPIICLVPPLLIPHWIKHMKIVFHDEPDRVQALSSASYFSSNHMNSVIVVSKWSWSKHYPRISKLNIQPSCVIIDEVHQGRTGKLDEDIKTDEIYAGISGIDEKDTDYDELKVQKLSESLRKCIKSTCTNSSYVISVSATPINLGLSELNNMLSDIGVEGYDQVDIFTMTRSYSKKIGDLLRTALAMDKEARLVRKVFFEDIDWSDIAPVWKNLGLDDSDIEIIQNWCESDEESAPGELIRALRELHPYGKNLSIVMRDYLSKNDAGKFRKRNTVVLDCKSDEIKDVWENIVEIKNGVVSEIISPELDSLQQKAMILHSNRTNLWRRENHKGKYRPIYSVNLYEEKLPHGFRNLVKTRITDTRVEEMLQHFDKIASGVSTAGKRREKKLGAVIFSEWKGTISDEGLMYDIKRINEKMIENGETKLRFSVMSLKGGQGIEHLRVITKKFERESLSADKFPILISSPAGEVGIEMSWASHLVHWDIHTNPQRMEQRTWRIDRRISDEKTLQNYYVLFPRYENLNLNDSINAKVESRWEVACNELGKVESRYISNSNQEVIGTESNIQLYGPEIGKLRKQFSKDVEKTLGYYSKKERVLANYLFGLFGFEFDADSLRKSGYFIMDWNLNQNTIFNKNNSIIRDLELVSSSLSDCLYMNFSDKGSYFHPVGVTSELEKVKKNPKARKKAIPRLAEVVRNLSPPFSAELFLYSGTRIQEIAMSEEILDLHETEMTFESGLVVKISGEWRQWSDFSEFEKEEYGTQLLNIFEKIQNGKYEKTNKKTQSFQLKNHDFIDQRISLLENMKNDYLARKEFHNTRLEGENCTEEDMDWRPDAIQSCENIIGKLVNRIDYMKQKLSSHQYNVILRRSKS